MATKWISDASGELLPAIIQEASNVVHKRAKRQVAGGTAAPLERKIEYINHNKHSVQSIY